MRKIILSGIGILIIAASVFFAKKIIASKKKPKPVTKKVVKTVYTDTVKNKTIPVIISANGNVTAKQRVELYSEVQGIFKPGRILFKEGQKYSKGQTLISIDAAEQFATVQSARSNLYNSISAIMPDLRLDYADIYPKWQAYLNSFDLNKSTPALPEIASNKENYFITGRNIISDYYNVKNLEQRLSKYQIRAPFTGILTESVVTEGTLIRNGQKLGEFINPSVYELEVSINKSFAELLKVGKTVELTNLDKTETYKGKVVRVNGSVDLTTQTIAVFIDIKDSRLKEGLYLEANLDAKNIENAIEIDRTLLVDNKELFVMQDTVLTAISVKPVHFSDSKVVIQNVPDGTVILKRPVPGAHVGMLVKTYESVKEKTK